MRRPTAIERAKIAQGYLTLPERIGCRNCAQRSAEMVRGNGRGLGYECTLGLFFVHLDGICQQYQPRQEGGAE